MAEYVRPSDMLFSEEKGGKYIMSGTKGMSSWDRFFNDKIKTILREKKSVVDIGGGLRISKKSGNRFDVSRAWIIPLLKDIRYIILDSVPDYNTDIVGDIHDLPF